MVTAGGFEIIRRSGNAIHSIICVLGFHLLM